MVTPKYYEKIEKLQKQDANSPVDYPFDLSSLKGNWFSKITRVTLQSLWFQGLLRRCWPIASIGSLVVVTRYDDASEILKNQEVFEAPFGREMTEMAGGTNFILGMPEGADYQQMLSWIFDAFRADDVAEIVKPISWKLASKAIDQSGGRIDVVRDLITGVPTKICRDYYGLDIPDEDGFAEWSIALSMLFFADPTGDPQTRRMARAAAEKLGRVIGDSIDRAKKRPVACEATVLSRLVARQRAGDIALTDGVIRSILTGMVAGFVPTNTLAAGNILEVLLEQPQDLAEARSAALANDDVRLERCLFEAMRFQPPLNPGLMRYATADFTVAKGTPRATTIKKGNTVIVATASAMHDVAQINEPSKFWSDRPDENDILFGNTGMLFGYGLHRCIGVEIARKQITQTLKALLCQKGLRCARGADGKLQRIGTFPSRLVMEYGESEPQSPLAMITVCAEVSDGVDEKDVKDALDNLGNPAGSLVKPDGALLKQALDKTGCLHFASMSVIEGDTKKTSYLVLELTADGKESDVIDILSVEAGQPLRKVFRKACGLKDEEDLADFLRAHVLDVGPRFRKTTGLTFCGTPWLSVERIEAEDALEKKVAALLAGFKEYPAQSAAIPRAVLENVRAELKNDPRFDFAITPAAIPFLDRKKAPWNTGTELGFWGIVPDLLKKAPVAAGMSCIALGVITVLIYAVLTKYPDSITQLGWIAGTLMGLFTLALSLILALVVAAVVLVIIALSLRWKLNRLEETDRPRDLDADPERLNEIMKRENAPRFIQNHMTAVSILKPHWLRRYSLLGVLYFIEKWEAMEKFRPGFLSRIGTIHFARWVQLPGTNKLLFFSNYSGSWESYMEDFITMAHEGLTAVWSNTCDFPRARNLIQEGATDGDRFKRWARRQQIPTLFWYARYPQLTTERIRTNAMIRDGIALARSDSDAEAWLSLFHSVPRPDTALEYEEIQTLAFGGMGRLTEACCILIKFGREIQSRAWLDETRKGLAFGEKSLAGNVAQVLALSASGLDALGAPKPANSSDEDTLPSFSPAFVKGMADGETRSRILGDVQVNDPSMWAWGNKEVPIDAVLLIYAAAKDDLDAVRDTALHRLSDYGHQCVRLIRMQLNREAPPNENLSREPFGFVDGISQPVIRGTHRYYKGVDEMHVVAAGELILGYPDARGQFPATPQVHASDDPDDLLPSPPQRLPQRFPKFDPRSRSDRARRDLGRNGSYLVIRQLEQNVAGFDDFIAGQARLLNERYGNDGQHEIDAEWVAAKMVGRWRDGASLARHPSPRKPATGPDGKMAKRKPDNDFWLGQEDPQGHRCPFGAHIRRCNPRDSLNPGSREQLMITNRHRILRVGRPYVANEGDGAASGMLFMCLNANIERQFEFIQQTWIQAPTFHGRDYEVDPIVGTGSTEINTQEGIFPPKRQFWIPSPAGAVVLDGGEEPDKGDALTDFVKVRGGGYFFLPGRRALEFLSRPR